MGGLYSKPVSSFITLREKVCNQTCQRLRCSPLAAWRAFQKATFVCPVCMHSTFTSAAATLRGIGGAWEKCVTYFMMDMAFKILRLKLTS